MDDQDFHRRFAFPSNVHPFGDWLTSFLTACGVKHNDLVTPTKYSMRSRKTQ